MAIASFVMQTTPEGYASVLTRLRTASFVAEMQEAGAAYMIALVVEAETVALEETVALMQGWDGVVHTSLVGVNYEDELERAESIPYRFPTKHGLRQESARAMLQQC